MTNTVKNKLENCSCNYVKNFYKFLIVPAVIMLVALVFTFVFGLNKGLDYKGGVLVSVVAGTQTNLDDSKVYEQFKNKVDGVLKASGVQGDVYSVEVNAQEEYVLVVKFAYSGDKEKVDNLVSALKSDLVSTFYSDTELDYVEKNELVVVDTFGSSVPKTVLLYVALATLVAVILMAIYAFARNGLNSAVLSVVITAFNVLLTLSLLMVTRVEFDYATIAVVPFVAIASLISVYLFTRKAKELLTTTLNYDKKSNAELANDVVKKTSYSTILAALTLSLACLIIGAININNSVLFLSLAFFEAIVCVAFTQMFVIPGLFALTYVRKVKKVKPKKDNSSQDKLTEEEVLKETDLNNLVSN